MEEDLEILNFVVKNGFKWAHLGRKIKHRTQHCLKNRFFSLVSKSTNLPIRKLKQQKIYLNPSLIAETLKFHDNSIQIENSFQKENSIQKENSTQNEIDLIKDKEEDNLNNNLLISKQRVEEESILDSWLSSDTYTLPCLIDF